VDSHIALALERPLTLADTGLKADSSPDAIKDFCDDFARLLAARYLTTTLSWEEADLVANNYFLLMVNHCGQVMPQYAWDVFMAFDEGETHGESFTRSKLLEIEARHGAGGQPVRLDEAAVCADEHLPAFLARPPAAPAYYGFAQLPQSEKDGFVFGVITEPRATSLATWGDAFVIAPNGSRAGIVWTVGSDEPTVMIEPEAGRWGVYGFSFPAPISGEQALIENLHAILPILKEYYARAERICPESTR
jgi:hypothetical protein